MKWTIEYLEKDKIVAAKVNGLMDWDEHRKFAEELYPFAHKKGSHRILIDFREMIPILPYCKSTTCQDAH